MIQGDKLGRRLTVADDLLAALNVAKERGQCDVAEDE